MACDSVAMPYQAPWQLSPDLKGGHSAAATFTLVLRGKEIGPER